MNKNKFDRISIIHKDFEKLLDRCLEFNGFEEYHILDNNIRKALQQTTLIKTKMLKNDITG